VVAKVACVVPCRCFGNVQLEGDVSKSRGEFSASIDQSQYA